MSFGDAALGRFNSPDPGNAGANLFNPQSWNAYSYVANNPLTLTDPTGMCDSEDPSCFSTSTSACKWWQIWCWAGGSSGGDNDVAIEPIIQLSLCCQYVTGEPSGSVEQQKPARDFRSSAAIAQKSGNIFSCASEAAANASIAGALQRFGIGRSGVGGFVTNALGGNAFSGLTDLVQSFGSGAAGGHNVFYNMGQGLAAGPTQGLGAAFGKGIVGTPWGSGPVDVASTALATGGMKVITGAGRTIQTINGAAKLGTVLGEGAEYGSGIGEAKLDYDFVIWAGSVAGCAAGVIH